MITCKVQTTGMWCVLQFPDTGYNQEKRKEQTKYTLR